MRKRHPNNIGIKHNPQTGLYEIADKDITYAMPMELTTPLKAYFRYYSSFAGDDRSVGAWYKALPSSDKAKVQRSGAFPPGDAFHPDVSYE